MIKVKEHGFERIDYIPAVIKGLVLFAHGAGAGNQHEFMKVVSKGIAEHGYMVSSFNFPYMQTVYSENKKRPPNKIDILKRTFVDEIKRIQNEYGSSLPLFIIGKSMGGRVASMLGSGELPLSGIAALGYPFIPPGKPEKLTERMAHFTSIKAPMLILQGQRDSFGNEALLNALKLPKAIELKWVKDGDHSFKPRKASGITEVDNLNSAVNLLIDFFTGNSV